MVETLLRPAPRRRRRVGGPSLADFAVLAAAALVAASLLAPWLSLGGFVVRPVDLLGVWGVAAVFFAIGLAPGVAARWPYTRWLGLVPLVAAVLLLGVLAGVAATVLVLNPHLAGLPWQDANEVAQTVSRVAGFIRLQSDDVDGLVHLVGRFALEPQVSLREGPWLFGAGALTLIVAGYRKALECFGTG